MASIEIKTGFRSAILSSSGGRLAFAAPSQFPA
jgi:hypothetical protein